MGLFTSRCKQCEAEIAWFIHEPQNYYCKVCGCPNSAEEIRKSHFEDYARRMKENEERRNEKDQSNNAERKAGD